MLAQRLPVEALKIDPDFLNRVLAPYKPADADYLKSASITTQCPSPTPEAIVTAIGQFSIPWSCYIKDTGHFNAVEYLICFNQLAYSAFGHLFASGFFNNSAVSQISLQCRQILAKVSIETFFEQQLSSMLILKATTRFKRLINAKYFTGELSIQKFFHRKGTIFTETSCVFTDNNTGYADGNVLLAYRLHFSQ